MDICLMPAGRPWCGRFPGAAPTPAQLPTPCSVCHLNAERAPAPPPVPEWIKPRFLDDLTSPQWMPRRGRREPYWAPELPPCAENPHVVMGWQWSRPYSGPVARLDRAGAWIAAAASAEVGHGAFEHTGALERAKRPGYNEVRTHQGYWTDPRLPSPLGAPLGDTAWVLTPTAQHLAELAERGRWPEAEVLDSYTCDPVRLSNSRGTGWIDHVRDVRADALRTYGRQSDQYTDVKRGFGEVCSMLQGKAGTDGGPRYWRSKVHRRDWPQTWQALAAATLWRWADDVLTMCGDELGPVELANTDELVIPVPTLEIVTTRERPPASPGGKPRPPMVIEPLGATLGTFKVKGNH